MLLRLQKSSARSRGRFVLSPMVSFGALESLVLAGETALSFLKERNSVAQRFAGKTYTSQIMVDCSTKPKHLLFHQ